jgi:hypothetical protein
VVCKDAAKLGRIDGLHGVWFLHPPLSIFNLKMTAGNLFQCPIWTSKGSSRWSPLENCVSISLEIELTISESVVLGSRLWRASCFN